MGDNKNYWDEMFGDSFDESDIGKDFDTGENIDIPVEINTDNEEFDDVQDGVSSFFDNFEIENESDETLKEDKEEKSESPLNAIGKKLRDAKSARQNKKKAVAEKEEASEQDYQDDLDHSSDDTGPDDFEIKFDFDKEYGETVAKEKIISRRKGRKTGCIGGILYFLFILVTSVVLACVAWMMATDVLALGKPDGEVEVTIPEGYTVDSVAELLNGKEMIDYKWVFKLYANFSHADQKIDPGTYVLNRNYDYRAIVNGMTKSSGKMVETEVTIPEGYTLTQIFNLLEENRVCSSKNLWEAAANYDFEYDFLDKSTIGQKKRLEGFLFPDTYKFYENDDPENVIEKMLDVFEYRFDETYLARAEELGYSVRDIVSIASIIEREAGHDEEREDISAVLHNRLNDGTMLQVDSTLNYIVNETGVDFSTELDSPYNTYMYEGLPESPIANPGLSSIEAALYPSDEDYYYFALGVDGYTHFFSTSGGFTEFVNSDEYGG